MKRIAALAISVPVVLAQSERAAIRSVTAIRNWSLTDVTRVAVEVSGEFTFRTDRLHNPERVYFDILNARPLIEDRRIFRKTLDDKLVQSVRAAETAPGVTRVVLDLAGPAEVSTTQLSNPCRLIIEVRAGKAPAIPTESTPAPPPSQPPQTAKADPAPVTPTRPDPVISKPETPVSEARAPATPPPSSARPASEPPAVSATPRPTEARPSEPRPPAITPAAAAAAAPPAPKSASASETSNLSATTRPAEPRPPAGAPVSEATKPAAAPIPVEVGRAARHNSTGGSSLTRALGLKVGRIVIDPGHGGHDQGTQGPKGLQEKDLVLDLAQRVGKLIEERMNAEVIYTRTDDTFVPLEARTAIANEKKADLFLSIHANSSPFPRIAGVETFYLNFTDSKEAMDVAARENAGSQKSISELQDIIQKITLHEKLDESKEFASRVQSALFTFTSRNVPGEKNRGIKKAPFVVLIGANMPSVLAEIGFLTNAREEAQLKRTDYRQKLAEALYRGVSRYAESLSHFQVAQAQQE